jgi:hypothetical protein
MARVGYHGLSMKVDSPAAKTALQKFGQDDFHATGAGLSIACSHPLPGKKAAPICSTRDWLRSNDTDADLVNASRFAAWATTLTSSWEANVGLGRIVTLYFRSSTVYHDH